MGEWCPQAFSVTYRDFVSQKFHLESSSTQSIVFNHRFNTVRSFLCNDTQRGFLMAELSYALCCTR